MGLESLHRGRDVSFFIGVDGLDLTAKMDTVKHSVMAWPISSRHPPNLRASNPRVLQVAQRHISFRQTHFQPQDSFFVADPYVVAQNVYRWRDLLPNIEPYYGKRPLSSCGP